MTMAKTSKKAIESRIERAYRARCCGVQINIMDIGKVFRVGEEAIARGVDDNELGDIIEEFVGKISLGMGSGKSSFTVA